ncbi:hypothetical protein [Halorussus halobius]|uniref:hypothetical protein n=1 Tax=Halorussus halobius TaxID=1710537 RepID=UPI001091DACB|nr:hypothetical protein [Halorussus halobius]
MMLDNLSTTQKHAISLAYYVTAGTLLAAVVFDVVGSAALLVFFLLVVARALWIWRFWVADS